MMISIKTIKGVRMPEEIEVNTLIFSPLTPGALCKKCFFLDILVVFRLDLSQISFNLVENAFATQQLAFLATGITFYDMHINQNFEMMRK